MQIATWNVNSIKARLPHMVDWLTTSKCDVVLVQELKCQTEAFPYEEIEALGYNCAVFGQKSYNGVAILSKTPIEDIKTGMIDDISKPVDGSPGTARIIEGYVGHGKLKVASVYVPNGNEVGSEKFAYKMNFYQQLTTYLEQQWQQEEAFILGGDFNVALNPQDVYNETKFTNRLLYSMDERACLRRLLNLGYIDLWQQEHPHAQGHSWWDYREGRYQRDEGCRIDYLLATPQAADLVTATGVDRAPREQQRPSDHTPVWAKLAA